MRYKKTLPPNDCGYSLSVAVVVVFMPIGGISVFKVLRGFTLVTA